MSLGPVRLGRQRAAGAVFVVALGAAIAGVLLLSGRTVGAGTRFEVELATPGPLRPGARVMLAGRVIGEVRGLRRLDEAHRHHVVADCFVARRFAADVRENSDVFVATPSILGEAFVEVGPPRRGAAPGAPVAEGARIRGADPPDIDRLLGKVYSSATEALVLLREHRADFDALLGAGDAVLADLAALPVERGQLARIRDRAADGIDAGLRLVAAVRDARVVPRARAVAAELESIVAAARPDLVDVAAKAERAADRLSSLAGTITDADRERGARALRSFARAARSAERVAADVEALANHVRSGAGTVGGFLSDTELWDDLHETHRLLKWQGWKLFVKTRPGKPTAPE